MKPAKLHFIVVLFVGQNSFAKQKSSKTFGLKIAAEKVGEACSPRDMIKCHLRLNYYSSNHKPSQVNH